MKRILCIFVWLILGANLLYAHDEGHGPKLTDSGKYGGLVAPIVDSKEIHKGSKAKVVYKAELVLSSSGSIRLYIYDQSMKPLDLALWDKSVKVVLGTNVKGKRKGESFTLHLDGQTFVGQVPKPAARPYDLDFHMTANGMHLLTAFDNLD